ncbi:hypothetical protein ACFFMN_22985 [Planobispora siamensis]|uniref:Uncharacterized protein n=1 Tax=Planobispora siamensis TaxID=936338 RepID=A0A8J3WMX3_9ACTN|nr:hypothetical protein [Planobispora siamensis]GIH95433.1 hypothetical protein Psi01_60630 [Planobispora siamensis]
MSNDPLTVPQPRPAALAINIVMPERTVHIGPFSSEIDRDEYARRLRRAMLSTAHPDGTLLGSVPHTPDLDGVDHLSPTLTSDPYTLADLIDAEPPGDGTGRTFPDVFTRLTIQYGHDRGIRLYENALAHTREEQAHADHFASHVDGCDRILELTGSANSDMAVARKILDDIKDAEWGGDGELSHADYADAVATLDDIRRQLRAVERIVTAFRREAESYRVEHAAAADERQQRREQMRGEKAAKSA